jgi:hypothetical protein
MTARHRNARGVRELVLIGLVTALLLPGPASARTSAGAEFERVTADIRAAVERHDSRAYHDFRNQLDALIARATGR